MSLELIIIIVIVAILAPLLLINTRKNKKQNQGRKSRSFMGNYLEEKKRNQK
ncbi:hypothetical protein [Kordia zhangzhouensis]|uniref:hypothetical protein n=1 Tax=Kordia zhangzhouensis TaxID=1620405 RepID=UPI0012FBE281|nr:hypothetical protein [Kordia zhangzhouensis]